MNKKNALQYIFIAAAFCIPSPARVAYGIVLLLIYNVVTFSLVFTKYWISFCNIERYSQILQVIVAVSVTIFCKELLTLYSPLYSLILGNIIYIISVSSLFSGFIVTKFSNVLSERIAFSMTHSGILSALSFIFFVVREYFAFGTISVPSQFGLRVLSIPSFHVVGSGYFWASIPGALVLLSLFIIIISLISRYNEIKWRSENKNV
jgi:hypothetical protein